MKKGPLTESEKYTIRGMFYDEKPLSEICKLTDRSKYVVNKFLESSVNEAVEKTKGKTTTKKPKKKKDKSKDSGKNRKSINIKDFIINETVGDSVKEQNDPDRRGGVSIMTEAGSQQGDESKSRNQKPKSRYDKHIHIIDEKARS